MVRVRTAGWKPTREAVAALVGQVKSAVEVDKPDCVVFFLLDNLQYLWRMLDGTTTQQQSDGRGKFHMEGELTIANKEVQLNIYKLVKPVLQAAGERPFVVITPMGRYLSAPCCEKDSHITNFRSENYEEGLLANLEEVKKNFRGFLFSDNIRKTLVLDLGPVLEKLGKEVCWGADPVHPSKAVYDDSARLLLDAIKRLETKCEVVDSRSRRGGLPTRVWRDRRRGGSSWRDVRSRGGRGGGRRGGRGGWAGRW